MEIIRKFKRPLSKRIVLNIPDHYVDKDLEILIIPVDQETKKHPVNKNSYSRSYVAFGKDETI